jgi:hypothetical protein
VVALVRAAALVPELAAHAHLHVLPGHRAVLPRAGAGAEPVSYFGDVTRVYTRTGTKAHLLPPSTSPNDSYGTALCGRGPEFFETWRGTGSQTEIETVAALPLCKHCERLSTAEAHRA